MTYLCKGHVKVFVNARFTYPKLKKCRTKSVDLRHPSFGILFNSRGKRDFFSEASLLFLLNLFQQILLELDRQIVVRVQLVNLLWRNCVHQPL